PLAPVLHYNPAQGDLVGGNFWDMRATGRRLGNPAAEQAQGPPTNPVEMGLPDIACAVYRASQPPNRALFGKGCGQQAFASEGPNGPWRRRGGPTVGGLLTGPARHPPTIRCRSISARSIAAAPPPRSTRWRSRSRTTRPRPR